MFTLNEFTTPIMEYWKAGKGHLVINAVAGSGKTTVLEELCRRMTPEQRDRSLFAAFNKHIVEELKSRLPAGITIRTINSLGGAILGSVFYPARFDVNDYKYRDLVDRYCEFHIPDGLPEYERRTPQDVKQAIVALVDKAMRTLSDYHSADVLSVLASRYGVEIEPPDGYAAPANGDLWDYAYRAVATIIDASVDEMKRALRSKDGREMIVIDYTDQIYMPLALNLRIPNKHKFSNILVDEAQDLNACQRELILRCQADGCRTIWVGDRRQAIYGFAGADSRSIDTIIELTGATELPLSVCWRCPSSHVRTIQRLIPQIQPAPTAIAGVEDETRPEKFVETVRVGDTVMCRCTAPLVESAFELIRRGIPAKVKGRDIGRSLTAILDRIEKLPGFKGSDFEKFPEFLDAYQDKITRGICANNKHPEAQLQALEDKCATIAAIYNKLDEECAAKSLQDIRMEIDRLFSDAIDGRCVQLMTVHKAKGLQAPRTFIIRPELMPHPMAKGKEEFVQEQNLIYIAATRSTEYICWVGVPGQR